MNNKPNIQDVEHQYAGVFLVTESGKIVGQRRDDKPTIDNPNKVAAFGGTIETGETPVVAVWRELTQEETNLTVSQEDIHTLSQDVEWRELTGEWEGRHFFYANIHDRDLQTMEVYEGQGWAYINGKDDPDLTDTWRPVVAALMKKLNLK